MAIKSLSDNTYYKVLWDESCIQCNQVLIAIAQYLTEDERLKEKERSKEISSFIEKLHAITTNEPEDTPREKSFRRFLVVEGLWSKYINQDLILKPDSWYEPLFKLGFKMEWIKDPIVLQGVMKVNCGDFDNCSVKIEYLYDKLKQRMNNIIDC